MLNKYLEGTIFVNFYLEGTASLLANFMASLIYSSFGVRRSFMTSMGITIVGAAFIYLFEAGIIDPSIAVSFGLSSKSSDPDGTAAANEHYLAGIIPIFGFITKLGTEISFMNAYQASFSNDTIFSIQKRATAIGICNFAARTLTICAPIVAEFQKPTPAIFLCIVSLIGWLVATTFLSYEDETKGKLAAILNSSSIKTKVERKIRQSQDSF